LKTTDYAGIDYGLGTTNIDETTGIRYGVISQHSLDPEALDEIYYGSHSTDLYYKRYVEEVMQRIESTLRAELPDDIGALYTKIDDTGVKRHETICDALTSALGDMFNDRSMIEVHEWVMSEVDDTTILDELIKIAKEAADEHMGDNYQGDEIYPLYEDKTYTVTRCLDSDLMILKSPFFSNCSYCSPCVPGAGNLNTVCEGGVKTYCLDETWFPDNKAPYPIYSVETGLKL
jgi:hypothetical protein